MPLPDLSHKLDPKRFPNMSPQMGGIPGYLLEHTYATPALVELTVTPDGHLVGPSGVEGGLGHTLHMGSESDLRANLRRFGIAAGLDEDEWSALAERVRVRLGIVLGG